MDFWTFWFDLICMEFWTLWFDLIWHIFLLRDLIWFDAFFNSRDLIWRPFLNHVIWFDLTAFFNDLSWFEFAKSSSIHFVIEIVDSCETNDTEWTSSLRAFDQCHICLWNLCFDPFIVFLVTPELLIWNRNPITIGFDLMQIVRLK